MTKQVWFCRAKTFARNKKWKKWTFSINSLWPSESDCCVCRRPHCVWVYSTRTHKYVHCITHLFPLRFVSFHFYCWTLKNTLESFAIEYKFVYGRIPHANADITYIEQLAADYLFLVPTIKLISNETFCLLLLLLLLSYASYSLVRLPWKLKKFITFNRQKHILTIIRLHLRFAIKLVLRIFIYRASSYCNFDLFFVRLPFWIRSDCVLNSCIVRLGLSLSFFYS